MPFPVTPPHTSACCAQATAWRSAATRPWRRPSVRVVLEAGERLGHERDACRDLLPVLDGGARHEVEALPDVLHRAGEDVQLAEGLAGVGRARGRARADRRMTSAATRSRSSSSGVSAQVPQRRAVEGRPLLDPVGGVVGHLGVVAGDALERWRRPGRAPRPARRSGRPTSPTAVVMGGLLLLGLRLVGTRFIVISARRSRGTVGRAARRTTGAPSAPRHRGRPGARCAKDVRPTARSGSTTVPRAGSERNAQRGRLPPGAWTEIRMREPVRNTCPNGKSSTRASENVPVGSGAASASAWVWRGSSSVEVFGSSLRWLARSQPLWT